MGIISRFPAGATKPYIEEIYNSDGQLISANMYGYDAIRDSAFYDCINLALTSLPSGITSIGNKAFYNCNNLVSLTFEGTPERIDSTTFIGCNNLTTINVPWAEGAVANAPWGAPNATINYGHIS